MFAAVPDKPGSHELEPSPEPEESKERLRLVAKLLVLVVLVGGPPLMLHTIWSNPVSAGEDDLIYYYPLRKMVGEALREGRWPVGNPREACGSVLMGDPQAALLHPTTWLFAVMETRKAYALAIWTAFWLAGIGTWLYSRRVGLGATASLFASVVFTYCGFMVGHRVHLSIVLCAAMLPWGMWCIEGLRSRPAQALMWWVPAGLLALAAGHWPTLIHVGILWTAYLLIRGRPAPRAWGVAALAGLLTALLATPQLMATSEALRQATRAKMGFAMAGENSFFPAAGLLAMFPFAFGSRTPGFFPQQWWGPWHLCEMLGYVGLATLVLAGAAAMRFYRRRKVNPDPTPPDSEGHLRPIVRAWVWIALGAAIWMLGYYLPTYWFVHAIPILGMVRCPARMVVGMDLALAILGGVAIHAASSSHRPDFLRTLRRGATLALPIAMVVALCLTKLVGELVKSLPEGTLQGVGAFVGTPDDALAAVSFRNPAVWVPLGLMLLTALVIWAWLRAPRRLAPGLVALVMLDLFVPAHFVDVPPSSYIAPDPDHSPAAGWLTRHAPDRDSYRIWGLADPYGNRQGELLLAKTCEGMGFSTISNYGPLHSPRHAHLWGFEIFGTNRDWQKLIRENHLLSLYNVRYLLAEVGSEHAEVLDEVRVEESPSAPPGTNLLEGTWVVSRAEQEGNVTKLRTPFLWRPSEAFRSGRIPAGAVVRISLEARAPNGGAADELQADLFRSFEDGTYFQRPSLALRISPERLGEDWRRFTWTCRTPDDLPPHTDLRLRTRSERPIEVRDAEVRECQREAPILLTQSLAPGERVYRKVAQVQAMREEDPSVAIYENRLFGPMLQEPPGQKPPTEAQIEQLRLGEFDGESPVTAPFIGFRSDGISRGRLWIRFLATSLPGVCFWIGACWWLGRTQKRTIGPSST
jgi:hypothetical protein